jgi:hypothetical protein
MYIHRLEVNAESAETNQQSSGLQAYANADLALHIVVCQTH